MPEILAPAGDMEKLKTALYFGADAVYLAGKKFGLRAFSGNFDEQELKQAVELSHSLNRRVYVTVNILAHENDFEGLKEYLQFLNEIKVDGVIVSDMGIAHFVKEYAKDVELHISTQSSITNKYTAMEWVKLGAKRLVLARELSLEEIKAIRNYIPKDVELECFVHGAMCISYSGRCLLSNYFTGRDSNRGACVQACRWKYSICEESRQNEHYPIAEDEHGTYILNSKDMCLVNHLKELTDAGINSFKIEGRMKSPYYVATVVNAYKRALKEVENNQKPTFNYVQELEKTSHRLFTTGFYFGANDKEYDKTSMPVQSSEFMAIVLKDTDENGYTLVEQRNKFVKGDKLEILSPTENFDKIIEVDEIKNEFGDVVEVADKVQQKLYLKTSLKLSQNDILRKSVA